MTTAHSLIARSVSHNEIVTAEYSRAIADELSIESDDLAETSEVVEYWGTTNNGDEWRVRLEGDRSERLDISDVAAVADHLGMSEDDECTPDGIEWRGEPADGAPVFLLPGYRADDGNADVHYDHATTGREAAEAYVADGSWGECTSTQWFRISTWQVCVSVDANGEQVEGRYNERDYTITREPEEPGCAHDDGHDWQSPHEIVGGCESNPGVFGKGGGVVITEVCMRCGCARITDTWAQDYETGEQGLTSVEYEPGRYADEIPSLEENDLQDITCIEMRRGAAHVLSVVRDLLAIDTDGGPSCEVPDRAVEVGEYVSRVSRAVIEAGDGDRVRRAIRLALWLAARNRSELRAAESVCQVAGIAA